MATKSSAGTEVLSKVPGLPAAFASRDLVFGGRGFLKLSLAAFISASPPCPFRTLSSVWQHPPPLFSKEPI